MVGKNERRKNWREFGWWMEGCGRGRSEAAKCGGLQGRSPTLTLGNLNFSKLTPPAARQQAMKSSPS